MESYTKAVAGLRFERVRVDFHVHTNLTHPFHLTSRHRIHMTHTIEDYTHFMYTEVDTVMPPETFSRQFLEADTLWAQKPRAVRTYTRMCSKNVSPHSQLSLTGFFDVHSPSSLSAVEKFENNLFILPKSTYSACWVYPRDILKVLKRSQRWETTEAKYTTATGLNAIRELQSKPLHDKALIPLDADFHVPSDVHVWHLGGSGQLFCSEYCSFNLQHDFVAKPFVYLINSENGRTPFIDEVLVSHNADVFVLAWSESANPSKADLFLPNSTWTSGRNALYNFTLNISRKRGFEYEYFIFLDEDAVYMDCDPTLNTTSLSTSRYDFRRRCWTAFEEKILLDKPAVASPHTTDVGVRWNTALAQRGDSETARCVFEFDAQLNAFSAAAALKVLPYLEVGGKTWTGGSRITMQRASTLFLGDVIVYPQFNFQTNSTWNTPAADDMEEKKLWIKNYKLQ